MKHKHADLIHAWADGAEIQCSLNDTGNWLNDENPDWNDPSWKFRIKPEEKKPVVRWLWAWIDQNNDWNSTTIFLTEEEAAGEFSIKLEWSRTEFPE